MKIIIKHLKKYFLFILIYRIIRSIQFYFNNRLLNHFPSNRIRIALLKAQGMKIGKNVIIYDGFEIRSPRKIKIGNNTIIGFQSVLDGRLGLVIGENVNMSNQVMIWTLQHDFNSPEFNTKGGKVIIGDRVWLSLRSTILPNITINEGAVVAAGAVVTKNVEKYAVVGGVPAKFIVGRNNNLIYTFNGVKDYYFV